MNIITSRFTRLILPGMAAGVIGFAAHAQSGGPFTLDWSTLDGGGGACAGGVGTGNRPRFSLRGAISQAEAALSTGGAYFQQGGFLPAAQKDALPPLTPMLAGNVLTITWPSVCQEVVVETAASVTGPVWTSLGNGTVVGANRQISVPSSSDQGFFRLRKNCPGHCAGHCVEQQ